MSFSLYIDVPYEGKWEAVCGSLDEIKDWIKENSPNGFRYDWEDMDIVCNSAPSVFELMEGIAH